MSPVAVSLLITAGVGAWLFTKLQKYSGNNTQQSAAAAAAICIFIFIVLLFIVSKILG